MRVVYGTRCVAAERRKRTEVLSGIAVAVLYAPTRGTDEAIWPPCSKAVAPARFGSYSMGSHTQPAARQLPLIVVLDTDHLSVLDTLDLALLRFLCY